MLDRFARGEDIGPFLKQFAKLGYNVLRAWPYVTWSGTGWGSPHEQAVFDFVQHVSDWGFVTEITLLTDDDPARLEPAASLVRFLAAKQPKTLVLEIGNEPEVHKDIDTHALRSVCQESGFLYSSGEYEQSAKWFGSMMLAHTPRDDEWPRKAHDLLEYYNGGGPGSPSDPAVKCPCVADEPIRPDQAGYVAADFMAYAGASAILGAGATFHAESLKYARLPTSDELRCAEAFAAGLLAFPADAPNGPYRRIDEGPNSLRTYVVGNQMVRVRPRTLDAPESGWRGLDSDGILFIR